MLQVRDIDNQIANLEEQIEMWRLQACRCTADPSSTPSGGGCGYSRMEEYTIRALDAERDCERLRDALTSVKQHVVATVEKIPDITQRRVLLHRYIYRKNCHHLTSWDDVAAAVNYSKPQVIRIHGKALLALNKIIKDDTQ